MFEIITFGSGTWDIFLKSEKFFSKKGLCFNLGSKVDVEDVFFSSGGGGTNTAATFARQGLATAWCGVLGQDIFSKMIVRDLRKRKIKTRFIKKIKEKPTNFSVILTSPGKDRTVLAYRGASGELNSRDIAWQKLRANWFYLAPLSGRAARLTEKIVSFAEKNGVKVALNPGNSQLGLKNIRKIIKKVDILILNQEEASLLSKSETRVSEMCSGITIITSGSKGALILKEKKKFKVRAPKVRVADKTGAGDAFGSGFVSGFIKSKGDIEFSSHLAMANAVSCIKKIGAKQGLL